MKNKTVKRLLLISMSALIGLFVANTKLLPFATNFEGAALAQTEAIVGSWRLAAYETRNSQGELINEAPWHYDQGILIYDPNGHMSVQLMNNNRPNFASGDLVTEVKSSKPEDLSAAILDYLAYFGTYTATVTSEQKGVVIHHVQASTNNYAGSDQKRVFELAKDQLILTKFTTKIQTTKGELTSKIVWERL